MKILCPYCEKDHLETAMVPGETPSGVTEGYCCPSCGAEFPEDSPELEDYIEED